MKSGLEEGKRGKGEGEGGGGGEGEEGYKCSKMLMVTHLLFCGAHDLCFCECLYCSFLVGNINYFTGLLV